jgi:hypothetical protein
LQVPQEKEPTEEKSIWVRMQHGVSGPIRKARLGHGIDRIIITREKEGDAGVRIEWTGQARLQFFPVLDRAHFPVEAQA